MTRNDSVEHLHIEHYKKAFWRTSPCKWLPAQYLSAFMSGKTAVWSAIIPHFFKKGAFRAQFRGHSLVPHSAWCWEVLQYTQVATLSCHPLPAPVLSPPQPQELGFEAEQLCVQVPDKGLPTSVCDRCRAETFLPWYLAEPTLSSAEKFENFLYVLFNDSPQSAFKITDSGYFELHIYFSFWIWPKTS